MIKIQQIKKEYKNFVLDVQNINIDKGARIAIAGKNGSGKTTFVESLLGLVKVNKFLVEWNKKEYRINAVFQDSTFFSNFKVIEILKIYARLLKLPKNTDINKLLNDYDLNNIKLNKYSQLSGGQKQKVKICVAFMNNPQLLILDEVTTSLDMVWQKKIIRIIKNYYKKNPEYILLLITHSVNDIKEVCNKMLLFDGGKVISESTLSSKNINKVIKDLEKRIYD